MKINTHAALASQAEGKKFISTVLRQVDDLPGFSRISSRELDAEVDELFVRRQRDTPSDVTLWTARSLDVRFVYEPQSNLAFEVAEHLISEKAGYAWTPLTDEMINEPALGSMRRLRALLSEWAQWQLHPPLRSNAKTNAVSVNFAARCNLACDYCFNDRGRYGKSVEQRLDVASAPQLVDFLLCDPNLADPVQVICFGGEPLLAAKSIRAMVAEYEKRPAPKRRLTFCINTNGVLLKGEVVSLLDEHFDSVGVSIDLDESQHNAARPFLGGAESFAIIKSNLKRLPPSLRKKVSLEIVLTDPEVDFERYEESAQELDVRYADFGPVQGSRFSLKWGNGEVDRYVGNLERFYERRIGTFSTSAVRLISAPADALSLRFGRPIMRKCGAGRQSISIGSDGKIGGCWALQGHEELHMGDVFEKEPSFDRSRMRDYDELLNPQTDDICRSCIALNICGGHCSAMRLFDEEFRNRCYYLRRMSALYIGLRQAMSQEDATYVRRLHYDH